MATPLTFEEMGAIVDEGTAAIKEYQARIRRLEESHARLVRELGYIADAKRFDTECFYSDSAFADWAQNRCRAAVIDARAAIAAAEEIK